MRILMLSHLNPYPANNGAKLRIFHFARELAKHHELMLLCPSDNEQLSSSVLGLWSPPAPITWPLSHGERRTVDFLRRFPRDVQPAPAQGAATRTVAEWVNTWQPDALLITDPALGEYLRPYAGLKLMIDVAAEHGHYIRRVLHTLPLVQRPVWLLRLAKWEAYTRRLGRLDAHWIVPAAPDRDALQRLVPAARVAVIPNGVDTDALQYTPHADAPPQLVFSGALSYAPNFDALRFFCGAVWPAILARVPHARLLVTGDSSAAPNDVRSAPNVDLAGHLPDVRPAVVGSRASIAPLRLGVGTRLKILEAMALGTPVISTTVGAEGLDVTDGTNILIADAPERFAEHAVRLLTDGSLRERVRRAGRTLAETRYAWPVLGAAYSAAVQS